MCQSCALGAQAPGQVLVGYSFSAVWLVLESQILIVPGWGMARGMEMATMEREHRQSSYWISVDERAVCQWVLV
jgi:hypothetical protein